MNKYLWALSAIILFSGTRAFALNITPMLLEVDAVRGQTYTGSLDVYASSEEAEMAKVYLRDWDKNSDGADIEAESGTMDRSCGKWMTISPSHLDLPARGKISVKYTFTPPDDASGSYWTFIMVEAASKPVKPAEDSDKVQMMIETRLRYAVRMFINVRDSAMSDGKIDSLSVGPPTENGKFTELPLTAKVTFSNSGNTLLKPQGYVEVRNMSGEVVSHNDIQGKYYVIPGRERVVEVPLAENQQNGEYIALAVIDYGGESLVAGETRFSLPQDAGVRAKLNDANDNIDK